MNWLFGVVFEKKANSIKKKEDISVFNCFHNFLSLIKSHCSVFCTYVNFDGAAIILFRFILFNFSLEP